VNVNINVATDRGGKWLGFDARNIQSNEKVIKLILGFEFWRMSDFWRKWLPAVLCLPFLLLILLTTKHLIQINREVVDGFRYPNDISMTTSKGDKYFAKQKTS
jgi:hypothetical protein